MAQDCKGQVLEKGDRVFLRGTITDLTEGDDYCRVTFRAEIPLNPENDYTVISGNAAQFEKVPAKALDSIRGEETKSPDDSEQAATSPASAPTESLE